MRRASRPPSRRLRGPSRSPPLSARPSVTAGLRWAPLIGPAMSTPQNTANAHAIVMTIQPLFCALDRFSRTPATTPSPSRTSAPVPSTSARKISGAFSTRFLLVLQTSLNESRTTTKKSAPRHHCRDGTSQIMVPRGRAPEFYSFRGPLSRGTETVSARVTRRPRGAAPRTRRCPSRPPAGRRFRRPRRASRAHRQPCRSARRRRAA